MSESILLIPDISGFTDFINRTEITHSQHIISELLEIIIQNQNMGMEVAEIEGDAVLFYNNGSEIDVESIFRETEHMFLKFHRHIMEYENNRICNCGACSTATRLSLKFIVHKSEIGFTTINKNKKPFGPGLIVIHRLLKNKIKLPEYILFSENMFRGIEDYKKKNNTSKVSFLEGSESYKSIGRINYKYVDYSPLLNRVEEVEPHIFNALSTNPLTYEDVIDTPVKKVYEILSNLDYRLEWQQGVKELKYDKNRVNRIGTKHVCVFSGSKFEFETTSRPAGNEKMIYGEKLANVLFNREINIYYVLENNGARTHVRIEMHFDPQSILGYLMLPLAKYQFKKGIVKSFKSLKRYCESKKAEPKDFNS